MTLLQKCQVHYEHDIIVSFPFPFFFVLLIFLVRKGIFAKLLLSPYKTNQCFFNFFPPSPPPPHTHPLTGLQQVTKYTY